MKTHHILRPKGQFIVWLLLVFSIIEATAQGGQSMRSQWSEADSRKWSEQYNDSTQWDTATLRMDNQVAQALLQYDTPLRLTPFPTPVYDSPGNGNTSTHFDINERSFHLQYVHVSKGEHNSSLFDDSDASSATYFILVAPSNGQDPADFPILASSRNHPHYMAQGSLHTDSPGRIDWIALQMADNSALAVVNGRIFDLTMGRVILARTLADGTIRFRQLDTGLMDRSKVETTVRSTLSQPGILQFFNSKN